LLAGCATRSIPAPRLEAGEVPASLRLPQATALPVRVGVEHLTLGSIRGEDPPKPAIRVTSVGTLPEEARGDGVPKRTDSKKKERRDLRPDGKTLLGLDPEDPGERVVDRFLNELMGYDRHQEPRSFEQIGMFHHLRNLMDSDRRGFRFESDQQEENLLLQRWQNRLIGGPLAKALRELPIVKGFQDSVDVLKSDNLPLSEPYQESHKSRPDLGRISVRLRPGGSRDQVELGYVLAGWRVGSSPHNLKLGYTLPLAADLSLQLRSKYGYDAASWQLDSTLVWQLSARKRANLLLSNHLDLLTEPMTFPATSTSTESSNGLMFFFEHLF
jgi:hypothetical protein